MAYIANQQRKTYNANLVRGNFLYTIATFQINKLNRGGGQYPYSLFKIQTNWSSGSKVVNSELYVNQFILDASGTPDINYLPEGTSGAIFVYPISGSTNYSKYSHLLTSEDPNILDYFSISFDNLITDPQDPDYYLIDVIVGTPNYADGNLIADSYCYILNTI